MPEEDKKDEDAKEEDTMDFSEWAMPENVMDAKKGKDYKKVDEEAESEDEEGEDEITDEDVEAFMDMAQDIVPLLNDDELNELFGMLMMERINRTTSTVVESHPVFNEIKSIIQQAINQQRR